MDHELLARLSPYAVEARYPDEALEADFGPSLDGNDRAELFVALAGKGQFGFLQRYRYADNPDYLDELRRIVETPAEAFSLDYFVGEASMLRRGRGTALVAAGVESLWRLEPAAPAVIVPVNVANVASWRVLERASFRRVADGLLEPDNPVDGPEHHILRIDRPARRTVSTARRERR